MTSRRLILIAAFAFSFAAPPALVRAEDGFMNEEIKPAKKAKKKTVKKKKTYDYERSKYKSKAPALKSTYRFDSKGEPIVPGAKKKAPAKKKRSEPPEEGLAESVEACGPEETCAEKKSEADSL